MQTGQPIAQLAGRQSSHQAAQPAEATSQPPGRARRQAKRRWAELRAGDLSTERVVAELDETVALVVYVVPGNSGLLISRPDCTALGAVMDLGTDELHLGTLGGYVERREMFDGNGVIRHDQMHWRALLRHVADQMGFDIDTINPDPHRL